MRKQLGEQFEKANGIKLGFMSFFVKAACEALKRHPVVNASVDGNDIIYHGYQDISIAVVDRQGPGDAGAARRAGHELRRHRARPSPITPRRRATAS